MSPKAERLWRFRVQDILTAIQLSRSYTQDMDFGEFRNDRKTLDAQERNIILIGEATGYLPKEVTSRFPSIPWRKMGDMRNVVVHQYWGVDPERLWDTIQNDLPPLVPLLEQVLQQPSQ